MVNPTAVKKGRKDSHLGTVHMVRKSDPFSESSKMLSSEAVGSQAAERGKDCACRSR